MELITVTIQKYQNPNVPDISLESLTQGSNFNDNIRVTIIDGLHRNRAIINLSKDDSIPWASSPVPMMLILRKDGRDMRGTEILAVREQSNKATSVARKNYNSFSETIFTAVSYWKSFISDYQISKPSTVKIVDVARTMVGSNFFGGSSEDQFRRYVCVGNIFFSHPSAYNLLGQMDKEYGGSKLGLNPLDSEIYNGLNEADTILILEAVSAYDNRPNLSGSFLTYPTSFYSFVDELLNLCRSLFDKFGIQRKLSFPEYLNIALFLTKNKTFSIRELFHSCNRLCNYIPLEKSGKSSSRAAQRQMMKQDEEEEVRSPQERCNTEEVRNTEENCRFSISKSTTSGNRGCRLR